MSGLCLCYCSSKVRNVFWSRFGLGNILLGDIIHSSPNIMINRVSSTIYDQLSASSFFTACLLLRSSYSSFLSLHRVALFVSVQLICRSYLKFVVKFVSSCSIYCYHNQQEEEQKRRKAPRGIIIMYTSFLEYVYVTQNIWQANRHGLFSYNSIDAPLLCRIRSKALLYNIE